MMAESLVVEIVRSCGCTDVDLRSAELGRKSIISAAAEWVRSEWREVYSHITLGNLMQVMQLWSRLVPLSLLRVVRFRAATSAAIRAVHFYA